MKERQSINLFCYLCYVKILILGKYIHSKFALKCGCGAAERGQSGAVCCVLSVKALAAVCKSTLRSFSVCCLTSSGGGHLERVLHGLKSYVQAIFTPLLSAVIWMCSPKLFVACRVKLVKPCLCAYIESQVK